MSLITEEIEIFKRIQKGDEEAKYKIIKSNLGLVVNIAKEYINYGLDFEDLKQEGILGLINAVKEFDYTLGTEFSTFATDYIRRYILIAISEKGNYMKIPFEIFKLVDKVIKSHPDKVITLCFLANELKISIPEATKLWYVIQPNISLNNLSNNCFCEYIDLIPSYDYNPNELVKKEILKEQILELFEKCELTEKEKLVLKYIFGLDNKEELKLKEIGIKFGVNSSKIRKIYYEGMQKIRSSDYILDFLDYKTNINNKKNNLNKKVNGQDIIIKCFYDFFDYTPQQVDAMIKKLPDYQQYFLMSIFGSDLSCVTVLRLDCDKFNKLKRIITKIRMNLSRIDPIKKMHVKK